MKNKLKKALNYSLIFIALATIIHSDIKSFKKKLRVHPTQSELEEVLPGADLRNYQKLPIPHYPAAISEEGKLKKAAALLTKELPPEIRGFSDEINILFSIDETGKILKLKVLSHKETPYYMRLIQNSGFFEKLTGINYKDLKEVKAVSSASVSSQAMLKDLEASANLAAKKLFGLEEKETVPEGNILKNYLSINSISIVLIFSLAVLARATKRKWLKDALLIASLFVLGFWLRTPLALPHFFQLASLDVPVESNHYLVLLAGFVILTTIIMGPIYCGYICPFGALQYFVAKLSKNRWHPSPRIIRFANFTRYLVLFATVIGFFGLGIKASSELEPFLHLFARTKNVIAWFLIVFTVFISLRLPRFWCRFFCPSGSILLLLSSHRRFLKTVESGVKSSEIELKEE